MSRTLSLHTVDLGLVSVLHMKPKSHQEYMPGVSPEHSLRKGRGGEGGKVNQRVGRESEREGKGMERRQSEGRERQKEGREGKEGKEGRVKQKERGKKGGKGKYKREGKVRQRNGNGKKREGRIVSGAITVDQGVHLAHGEPGFNLRHSI